MPPLHDLQHVLDQPAGSKFSQHSLDVLLCNSVYVPFNVFTATIFLYITSS